MGESIYQRHKPSSSGGDFLKLKDGDKVKLRIYSKPAISIFKPGDKFRYSWVVWNRDLGKAQVYSAGISVYNAIADLTEEWGEPTEFDIAIKRTGSGIQDTSYSVTPIKNSDELTKEQVAEVKQIDLVECIKGKWLEDYEEDGELPEPIMSANFKTEVKPTPQDSDAPINLNDIPF